RTGGPGVAEAPARGRSRGGTHGAASSGGASEFPVMIPDWRGGRKNFWNRENWRESVGRKPGSGWQGAAAGGIRGRRGDTPQAVLIIPGCNYPVRWLDDHDPRFSV